MNVRCLYDGKFMLSESPLWCERTHSLWWVNMVGPSAVYRLPWGQEEPEVFPSSVPVTSIAFSEDNNLLIIRNYPSGADMPKKCEKMGGGARRDRTDDLYNAIVALSQLSYGPLNPLIPPISWLETI